MAPLLCLKAFFAMLLVVYSGHFYPDFTGGLIHLGAQLLFYSVQLL